MTKRTRGGRVPGTFTAPHTRGTIEGTTPRCAKCDQLLHTLEHRPQDIPLDQLVKLRRAVDEAAPPYGEMVRANAAGVEVWACPRHTSLERKIGRSAHGAQTVEWTVVLDPEKAKAAAAS